MKHRAARKFGRWPAVIACAFMLGACAANGPAFVPAAPPPPGKALVYVYRGDFRSNILGNGLPGTVRGNAGRLIGKLRHHGYLAYYVPPGPTVVELFTKGGGFESAWVAVDVLPGDTVFIRSWVAISLGVGAWGVDYKAQLEVVDPVTGSNEITVCRKETPVAPE